jgi:hypothetical protein
LSVPDATSPKPPEPDAPGPLDQPPASPALTALRLIAVVGTSAVVLWKVVQLRNLGPRQESAFVVLVLAAVAVALALWRLLPAAADRLRRHPDLLLPLGLYVPAEALVNLLATVQPLAAILNPAWPLKLWTINLQLSVLFFIQVFLELAYAGWTTVLVLNAVRGERVDPVAAIADLPSWFARVFAAEFVGWGVLFAGVAVGVAVGSADVSLAMILIGAGALVWNLCTAALLPVTVAEGGAIGAALRSGFRVSLAGKRRWWLVVVVQMLLLGWVTYISVSFTRNPRPGVVRSESRENWNVNGFWTGGYDDTCRWHGDLMKTLEVAPVPLVATLLTLLFAVLAIAIKLRIAGDIYGLRPAEPVGDAGGRDIDQPGA